MVFSICAKQGWVPEVVSNGTIERLEEKRRKWREKRQKRRIIGRCYANRGDLGKNFGILHTQNTDRRDILHAPQSIRDIKILDPSCGTGHFLVIAIDYLFELYQEEKTTSHPKWRNKIR